MAQPKAQRPAGRVHWRGQSGDVGAQRPGRNAALTRLAWDCGSVCYFVRLDGLVKIGYASDLRRRLSQLKAPYDDVLWIEPGGRARESELHTRFAVDRVTGEMFTLSPDIIGYVNECRAALALPPLAA